MRRSCRSRSSGIVARKIAGPPKRPCRKNSARKIAAGPRRSRGTSRNSSWSTTRRSRLIAAILSTPARPGRQRSAAEVGRRPRDPPDGNHHGHDHRRDQKPAERRQTQPEDRHRAEDEDQSPGVTPDMDGGEVDRRQPIGDREPARRVGGPAMQDDAEQRAEPASPPSQRVRRRSRSPGAASSRARAGTPSRAAVSRAAGEGRSGVRNMGTSVCVHLYYYIRTMASEKFGRQREPKPA